MKKVIVMALVVILLASCIVTTSDRKYRRSESRIEKWEPKPIHRVR